MNKMHVELTAVRETFETHKAELAQTVSNTNLKAALSISKEFRNYFFNIIVIVCMLPSSIFLTIVYWFFYRLFWQSQQVLGELFARQ